MNATEGQRTGGSTGRGVLIGVLVTLGVLALLAAIMFLAMGRCPMCGGMMGGSVIGTPTGGTQRESSAELGSFAGQASRRHRPKVQAAFLYRSSGEPHVRPIAQS